MSAVAARPIAQFRSPPANAPGIPIAARSTGPHALVATARLRNDRRAAPDREHADAGVEQGHRRSGCHHAPDDEQQPHDHARASACRTRPPPAAA
jgi:hypothetical protein